MLKGDLANSTIPRILVCIDLLVQQSVVPQKRSWLMPNIPTVEWVWDRLSINQVWRFTVKTGVSAELIVFGMTGEEADDLFLSLDEQGTNPLSRITVYTDRAELLRDIPYMPDVLAVVDIDEYLPAYGTKGASLTTLV